MLEKTAVAGMRFMPGEVLYRIADLGTLWLMASVYEQDLADVELGQAVVLYVDAFPAEEFSGKVGFVYPTLDTVTRTAKVRATLANPSRELKPEMLGTAEIAGRAREVLALPRAAVLRLGDQLVVFVEAGRAPVGRARFQRGTVEVEDAGGDWLPILRGLQAGERVVVSGGILLVGLL